MRVYHLIGLLMVLPCSVGLADDRLPCPSPPDAINVVHHDVKSDVDIAVGKLGPVKAGDISAKTEVVTRDLVSKYPNADRVHVVELLAATYCALLRDAKEMPAREKLKTWENFTTGAYAFMANKEQPTSEAHQSNARRTPSPKPQKEPTPATGSGSRAPPANVAPPPAPVSNAASLPSSVPPRATPHDNIDWNTNFNMTVSGAGKSGQIYGWYVEGKSPSFVKLEDAYIVSKLTGRREKLAAYDLVYQKVGELDAIETVPPNALIRLGVTWPAALSPQQFMNQWGQMELVVIYNGHQRFT